MSLLIVADQFAARSDTARGTKSRDGLRAGLWHSQRESHSEAPVAPAKSVGVVTASLFRRLHAGRTETRAAERIARWSAGAIRSGVSLCSDTEVRDLNGTHNEVRSKMGGLYANYDSGLSLDAMTFYSVNDNSIHRSVLVGATRLPARADFDSDAMARASASAIACRASPVYWCGPEVPRRPAGMLTCLAELTARAVGRPAQALVSIADAMKNGNWRPALDLAHHNRGGSYLQG
jgi:hypothetical protein